MQVVCKIPVEKHLTKNKKYDVLHTINYVSKSSTVSDDYVVISDKGAEIRVSSQRFESLSLERKRKLKKL